MASNADLNVRVRATTQGLNQANREVGAFGRGVGKLGTIAKGAGVAAVAAAGIAAVKFGKDSLAAASDLQQAQGAVESVFKSQSKVIEQYSKDSAQRLGLARQEYLQLASVTGAQLKGMGIPLKDTAKLTDTLTTRAADLAATFGGSTSEALGAIGALLRGERDPIERYGVSLKQTDINARLAAKGQDKLTGSALTQAQAQASLDLLLQKTKDSQGQFAREADTLAGAQARASAKFKDAQATIGTAFLPVMTKLYTIIGEKVVPALILAAKWIGDNVVPVLKQVGQWIRDNVLPAMQSLFQMISAQLVPIFQSLWSTLQTQVIPTLRILWTWFQKYLWPILRILVGVAIFALINQFRIAVALFRVAATVLATLVRWISNAVTWFGNLWRAMNRLSTKQIAAVRAAISAVAGAAQTAYRWVVNLVQAVGRASGAAFRGVASAAQSVWSWCQKAYDAVRRVVGAVASTGSGFLSGAIRGITTLIGWVREAVDWVGRLLAKLGGKALAVVRKVVPGLRYGGMSHGGYYMVGERGPELVRLPYRAQVTNAERTKQVLAAGAVGGGTGVAQPLDLHVAFNLGADTITRTVRLEIAQSDSGLIQAMRARRG